MQRIKNDPETYLRRASLGWDVLEVATNRSKRTRSRKDFQEALIEPSFYMSFVTKTRARTKRP
jgi:hypothetical protein